MSSEFGSAKHRPNRSAKFAIRPFHPCSGIACMNISSNKGGLSCLTPPPRFTFFQCRGEDLFAFSHDITGANIPRSPCTQGWIFCEQFELGPRARSSSNNGRANPEGDRKQRILRLAWLERFIRPAEPPARLTEGNICHRPEPMLRSGTMALRSGARSCLRTKPRSCPSTEVSRSSRRHFSVVPRRRPKASKVSITQATTC